MPTEGEPTPEAESPVESARQAYTDYVAFVESPSGNDLRRKTNELLAHEDRPAARAHAYAIECADIGRPDMAVGFLERTTTAEEERMQMLAQAEEKAAKNVRRLGESLLTSKPEAKRRDTQTVIVTIEDDHRARAEIFKAGAAALAA